MVFQEAIDRPACSHSSRIIDALSTDNYFESRKSFSHSGNSIRLGTGIGAFREGSKFSSSERILPHSIHTMLKYRISVEKVINIILQIGILLYDQITL